VGWNSGWIDGICQCAILMRVWQEVENSLH
jgi:hypothetical protein